MSHCDISPDVRTVLDPENQTGAGMKPLRQAEPDRESAPNNKQGYYFMAVTAI
jgi:hypothetical protein